MLDSFRFRKQKKNGCDFMNKKGNKTIIYSGLILSSILCIVFIYWLYPKSENYSVNITSSSKNQSSQHVQQLNSHNNLAQTLLGFQSSSQTDTETNCQLQFNASKKLIINEQTRNCFEYFLSQYGERNITEIRKNFQLYLEHHFQSAQQQQILALWSRYLDYREALSQLQIHETAKENYRYFQAAFHAIQDLKQRFFSTTEIEGLFGTEDEYQQYTLDRMQILENNSLDTSTKAKLLQERFEQLPQDWQENIKDLSRLEDLRALTAQIKAHNGSPQELRDMRLHLVGEAATQRLEQLDQQRSVWKQQVQSYLEERKTIIDSNMSASAKTQAIQQLKQQQFKSTQEQQRLQTFETIYDQGGTLPFSY